MTRQVAVGLCLLLAFVVAMVGCAGRSSPTASAMSTVHLGSPTTSPTPEAVVSRPSETPATLQPTSAPTSAPSPPPSPTAEATRIEFGPGMTYANITGELATGGIARYVLRAQASQLMEVSLLTGEGIELSIEGADGTALKSGAGAPFFRGTVPSSQDYLLVLAAGDQAVSYTMSVVIPERIQFSAAATSSAVQGELPARGTHYYVLRAEANQLMEVNASPDGGVQTVIYGMDGTVLKSGMSNGSFFRGTLPSTQDYVISLSGGDQAISFNMNVIIAERIEFAPGSISAVEQGEVGPGREQAWVLAASERQTMRIEVVAPGADVRLVVYGVDGTVLKSGMGGGPSFEGTLPSTQDYIVVVGPADRSTSYRLEVSII
jgi:hypothetical protein